MRVELDGWKTIMRLRPKGVLEKVGIQKQNWPILQIGNPMSKFAVLVSGKLLMFLKSKFPKINANCQIFTSTRTGLRKGNRTATVGQYNAHSTADLRRRIL
jgi:hypothetical protein